MKKKHVIFGYNKITPLIYVGTNACCQMHFKKELLAKGIRGDISLEGEMIDQPQGVDYFLWLPTPDHKAPSLKQLLTGVRTIDSLIKQKVKIYIHCKNGHGRAPTLLAAYFISKGMSLDKAEKMIKAKRMEIHVEKNQRKRLIKFESYFKKFR